MRIRQVLLALALTGVAWTAVLVVGLLAGVMLLPAAVAVPVAAVLVLPGFVRSVVADRRRLGLRDLPRRVLAVAAGSFFLFWLAGMTAFIGLGGNASIQNGQYVLNNHGTLTVVDKATYDRQRAHEQRLALSGFGAFGVAAATLTAAAIARSPAQR